MFTDTEKPWIEAGYRIFAYKGPDALKVELLAREVGISKSSFYHHFADLNIFTDKLTSLHIHKAEIIAAEAKLCQKFDPDFILLLMSNKEDLLFNRQIGRASCRERVCLYV